VTLTVTDDDGATDMVEGGVTVAEPNQAPTASFSWNCTDFSCDFTDASTDGDGSIVSWDWNFGDGWSSNGQNPNHMYEYAGTYEVSLTVIDDDGASHSVSEEVTVGSSGVEISLSVLGYKVKGRRMADLTWSGATSGSVDVFRNDTLIQTTSNDGSFTDDVGARGSFTYQVCEAGTAVCSNPVTVNLK
jgi:PKD repeat protein